MQGLTWDSSRSTGIDMPLSLVLGLVTVVGPHPISPQLHQLVSTRGHQPRSLEGLGVSWGQRWWWGPGTSRLWHPGRRIWRWRVGYRWRWAHGCWVWMISFSFPSFVWRDKLHRYYEYLWVWRSDVAKTSRSCKHFVWAKGSLSPQFSRILISWLRSLERKGLRRPLSKHSRWEKCWGFLKRRTPLWRPNRNPTS